MNLIKKYKTKRELEKEIKTPVRFVINSIFDYKDHDLNVLKECLNKWTENKDEDICVRCNNFKYSWMYVNPENKEKIYFVNTNVAQLKSHHLENLIKNSDILANSYMTSGDERAIFI